MLTPRLVVMLAALNEQEREMVIDHYVRDLSIADVAEAHDVSTGRVYQVLNKARGKMGAALEAQRG